MEANKIAITDEALRRGAEEGMDGFLKVFIDKYLEVTGGVVNAETMPLLNGYQHSLLGYHFLREEINEGGFVQLIQNGFGPYIFDNPFAKAMRQFGAKEFAKLIYSAKKIYDENRADLEKDRDDEEFMAMYAAIRGLRWVGRAVHGYGRVGNCPDCENMWTIILRSLRKLYDKDFCVLCWV